MNTYPFAPYNQCLSPALATGRQRIRHIRIEQNFPSLAHYLEQSQSISLERAELLIDLGSIYLNGRRQRNNTELNVGDILRIHLQPKRFSSEGFKAREAAVHVNEDFIVANKPHGLPTHPTLDNSKENLLYLLQEEFGSLWPVHRLDHDTAGLIVLGRSHKFARHFQTWLKNGLVEKYYRAICSTPPPQGRHIHFLTLNKQGNQTVSENLMTGQNQKRAELIINPVQPHPKLSDLYLVDLQLITGRTHQVRAQLAHLGAPIWGDRIYGFSSPSKPLPAHLELISTKIVLPGPRGARRAFLRPER